MNKINNAIDLKNICKSFGVVKANVDVCLSVKEGEILSLLGENGSGKTTLMNMISGIYQPDSGEIYVDGNRVNITSPEVSKKLGIGMVHQHFKLVDNFSVADNIIMGTRINGFKDLFLGANRYKKVDDICRKFGFDIDVTKKICDMSVCEKQTVEILKVLYYGAKVLILDEPTAVLTVQEIDKLFAILRKMRDEGHAIIIITHKLNEVMEISDRVAIMRKGEYIDTVLTSETNPQELTDMMVGAKTTLEIARTKVEKKVPLLEIRDLTILGEDKSVAIDKINFYIRGGEMLGVAGISGCGQKELCEAIAGLKPIVSGEIIHKGENVIGLTPKQIIDKGISMSFVPEDRLGMGLAPSMDIAENVILKNYNQGNKFNPLLNLAKAREEANTIVDELKVVTPSINTPVRQLSGGNVQKVLVGREIKSSPNVIITAYPVRGLDINSSYAIYDILNRQKSNGVGILFVGEDLDVMLALCDKIMVICKGKLMGVVHASKTTKTQLGLMMTGSLDLTKDNEDKHFGIAKDSCIKAKDSSEEVING